MLKVSLFIILICGIIYNIIKLIFLKKKTKLIIESTSRDINNYFAIAIGIMYLLFLFSTINIFIWRVNLINTLLLIICFIISLYGLLLGIPKSQIRENGIYTPKGIWRWDRVESYELIEYRNDNDIEGNKNNYCMLNFKVVVLKIGSKRLHRNLEFYIHKEQKEEAKEFLNRVVHKLEV